MDKLIREEMVNRLEDMDYVLNQMRKEVTAMHRLLSGDMQLNDHEVNLIKAGDHVGAIKHLRKRTGLSLRATKLIVDAAVE